MFDGVLIEERPERRYQPHWPVPASASAREKLTALHAFVRDRIDFKYYDQSSFGWIMAGDTLRHVGCGCMLGFASTSGLFEGLEGEMTRAYYDGHTYERAAKYFGISCDQAAFLFGPYRAPDHTKGHALDRLEGLLMQV